MAIYLECLYCMYVHTTRIDSADDDRLELRTVSSCHARWTMLDVGCRFGLHRMNGAPLFMANSCANLEMQGRAHAGSTRGDWNVARSEEGRWVL
jgi:hypothetical protein